MSRLGTPPRSASPCRPVTKLCLVELPYRYDPQGGDGLRWRVTFDLCGVGFESGLLTETQARALVAAMTAEAGESPLCSTCPSRESHSPHEENANA